jgi:alpha-1,6-mannosyltransferase
MALELAPSAPAAQRRALARPYVWLGLAGSLLIAVTAPLWRLSGPTWRFSIPGVPHNGERPITAIMFVIGASMLSIAWLGLISRVERSTLPERDRTRVVIVTALLWFAPVLLGPPLLSSDIYSYAAEGEMASRGIDPTADAIYRLQYGDYITRTDPLWRQSNGNPYGPVQMGSAAAIVQATGHDIDLTLWGLRLLAVGSVLASVWGLSEIARHYGVSPPIAVAIGIANPISVLHLVGGAHNDALLMALVATGCALALRGRWRLGVLFMALATGVKLPAAAAIVYLGWERAGLGAVLKDRARVIGKALAVSAALIGALCIVVGIGLFGWIASMQNAGKTMGTLSLTTRIGYVVGSIFRLVGLPADDSTWISLFRLAGLATAGFVCLRLLGLTRRIGAVQCAAISMMAVVLLGPVVWPWYLAPAIALLGAAGVGRWRPALLVLTVSFAFEVFPRGNSRLSGPKPVLESSHFVSLGLIILIAVLTVAAPYAVEWWRSLGNEERPGTDPLPFAPAD